MMFLITRAVPTTCLMNLVGQHYNVDVALSN